MGLAPPASRLYSQNQVIQNPYCIEILKIPRKNVSTLKRWSLKNPKQEARNPEQKKDNVSSYERKGRETSRGCGVPGSVQAGGS